MTKKSWYMIITISIIVAAYSFTQFQNSDDSHASQILDKCSFILDCTIDELELLALNESEKTILDTFQVLLSTYNESAPFCHKYGHPLGHFLYDYLDDIEATLSNVDPLACGGSTFHAIIEDHMATQLSIHKNPSDIDISTICSSYSNDSQTRERAVCLHGIGHGLTNIYNYDVFSAVNNCKQFDTSWEQTYCSKGVFMENIVHYAETGIGSINEDDLFFPCNIIEEEFAPACYFNQSSFILDYNLDNIDYITKCNNAPKEFVKFCYSGIGANMARNLLLGDTTSCQAIPHENQTYCYMGAVFTIAAEGSIKNALQFCTSIPEEFKSDCYGEVGKMIKMVYLDNEKRAQECAKSENHDFTEICMNVKLNEKRIF